MLRGGREQGGLAPFADGLEADAKDGLKGFGAEGLRDGAVGGDACAGAEHHRVVGAAEGGGEVVQDDDDGDAVVGEAPEVLHGLEGVEGIHAGGGFVGEENAGDVLMLAIEWMELGDRAGE